MYNPNSLVKVDVKILSKILKNKIYSKLNILDKDEFIQYTIRLASLINYYS